MDATEIAQLIRTKELSSLEAVEAAIARAEALQPDLNFLVTETFERARARTASAELSGPFAGVPYLVKDMFGVEGAPTRWGARFGVFAPPEAANSPQVDAMEAAGLVVIGTSALNEIGLLPTAEPSASGPTINPWDPTQSPGGSSCGAAVAVAAGVVPMADAADGGGSIRIPASVCGLFGLKPSRDRTIGRFDAVAGMVLTAEHCVSRSVRDSARLLAAMERQSGGAGAVLPPVGVVSGPSDRRLRVGLHTESATGRQPDPDVAAATEATARLLEGLGHRVEPTKWPFDGTRAMVAFSVIWAATGQHVVDVVRSIVGAEPNEMVLEPFTLGLAERARQLPDGAIDEARAHLDGLAPTYQSWLADFDAILSPVLLTPTVPVGHINGEVPFDTLIDRLSAFADYTALHNAIGAPAMSVPLGSTGDGLPIGSHFAARIGDERTLLELAFELEAAQPWRARHPPIFAM